MMDRREDPIEQESLAALLSRVVGDAEQVARAEIELQKAKIVAKIDDARNAILLLVAAIAIGSVALTAFVVGALLVLAQIIGPLGATGAVVGALVVLSALLGWFSMRQFKRLFGATEEQA
ncbi:MAG: phage holin family protein [Sphingomonas sp.]|uniref:phage holin family protein n=1 Tax=Sphingomonas sp. TaxID=28214 RepID=UPI003F37B90C